MASASQTFPSVNLTPLSYHLISKKEMYTLQKTRNQSLWESI